MEVPYFRNKNIGNGEGSVHAPRAEYIITMSSVDIATIGRKRVQRIVRGRIAASNVRTVHCYESRPVTSVA